MIVSHVNTNMLPVGWTKCSIGDLTLPVSKIDPKADPYREIDYIDISSIDNTRHRIEGAKHYQLKDAPSRARQIIHTGDVLFATVRPYLRNIASVPSGYEQQIASTGFSVLRPAEGVSPDFLFYKAISRDVVNALSGIQYGVSYPAVKDEQVRGQPLWLPPIGEQHRIVAKIEELFSELDKGIESLKTARAKLNVYRQAVLKHAFEGKLTAQWREQNKDKLEKPEQLLARIKRERAAHYERQLQEWEAALQVWETGQKNGRKPSNPMPPKPLGLLDNDKVEQLPSLPDGWQWVPFSWLLSIEKKSMSTGPFGTMLKKHEHQEEGVSVLGIENIAEGRFIRGNKIFVSKNKAAVLSSFEVEPGDLIISRSGTVGEICTVPQGLGKTLISTNLLRVSLNQKVVLSQFFVFMFQGGGAVKNQVKELCKGSSRDFLNQSILKSLVFPICSLQEQIQMIREIDEKLSLTDQLMRDIDSELTKSSILRQSILERAFSGQLVAQDPNDEPASILLERIKAEKVAQSRNTTTPKRRRRAMAKA